MTLTIDHRALAAAVKRVAPAAARHARLAALGCVLIDATPEAITLTASDLDTSVRTRVTKDFTADEPFRALVPAPMLAKAAAVLDDEMTIDVGPTTVTLATGDATITLPCADPDAFPRLEWLDATDAVALGDTWEVLGDVTKAASVVDAGRKQVLRAVRFDDGLIAATDSYRIHWADAPDDLVATVPSEALGVVRKALSGDAALATGERTALFTDGDTDVSCQLLVGEYPNWRPLAEADHPHRLTADTAALDEALAIASIVDDPAGRIYVDVAYDDGQITVSRTEKDTGAAEATCPADGTWPIEPVRLRAEWVRQMLAAAGDEIVVIEASSPQKPIRIRGSRVSSVLMSINPGGA